MKSVLPKQTAVSKLSLISMSLWLPVYLQMKGLCKLNFWISQASDTMLGAGGERGVLQCFVKTETHFKIYLPLFFLSTRVPTLPIKHSNIFSFSHICPYNTWKAHRLKKNEVPKEAMNNSLQPLKKQMSTFSIIHLTSLKFQLWFLCVCYALLSRLKQIGPMPQMTVANTLAALLGRSSDLPILTATLFDWLSLFVLVLNPVLNVAFPFWEPYSNEKNPKP